MCNRKDDSHWPDLPGHWIDGLDLGSRKVGHDYESGNPLECRIGPPRERIGNGLGTVRPFGPVKERRHVPMDPQNFGYLPFSPSFASCAFRV